MVVARTEEAERIPVLKMRKEPSETRSTVLLSVPEHHKADNGQGTGVGLLGCHGTVDCHGTGWWQRKEDASLPVKRTAVANCSVQVVDGRGSCYGQ